MSGNLIVHVRGTCAMHPASGVRVGNTIVGHPDSYMWLLYLYLYRPVR
jgi:hypothetical protein